ncbi:MAG: EAL domain-containing protein [Tahibacter sp.]
MSSKDDSQQNAELRQAFLRHLPKRLDTLVRRGLRQTREGWDINSLSLIFREVQTLAGAAGRYGLLDLGEKLFALETTFSGYVETVSIPDSVQSQPIAALLEEIRALSLVQAASSHLAGVRTVSEQDIERSENGFPLQLVAPQEYWKRFVDVTVSNVVPIRPDIIAASLRSAAPVTESVPLEPTGLEKSVVSTTKVDAEAPAVDSPIKSQPDPPAASVVRSGAARKVYHLSDGSPLACEIDQKLEMSGYELALLDNTDELSEMIAAIRPHLVIVDAHFLNELEHVGSLLKAARARANHRIAMLALSEQGDLDVRLRAMRAGADAFIALPALASDVMARIAELTEAGSTDPFRVLIVEDDRSQAIFAESILRKAGMLTTMVTDPLKVLDELERVAPDLILMDLYMPGCDGMELTAIIREREAFISTPIVFLSGEHDTEKHFEALNAGGDDFLSKPIRPKHLISAVTNRLRRARHIQRRSQNQNPRDPVSGMYDRVHVLDRMNAKLAAEEAIAHRGGVMLIELEESTSLREQIGLIGFDQLLGQIGAFLAAHVDSSELVARFGDASFVMFSPDRGIADMQTQALDLRDRTAREHFDIGTRQLHVGLGIGICAFAAALGDAGAMLNAAERAMVETRKRGAGPVGVYGLRPSGEALLVESIRDALRADAFHLVFQPIAALQGDDDGDAEEQFQVLLRLRGDDGKLLTASELVPPAEQAGLIDDVDRWVVGRCLMVLSERARQSRPVRLFVSQSLAAIRDPTRIGWLRQQLETRRLAGDRLVLEFRPSDEPDAVAKLAEFAKSLAPVGVGVCLAGLEPGEAGLHAIETISAGFVKISPQCLGDRSAGLRDNLRRLVHYAHERGRLVIAPRIEDAQSAALLWTVGVDYIQGNFVQHAAQDLDYDFRVAAS